MAGEVRLGDADVEQMGSAGLTERLQIDGTSSGGRRRLLVGTVVASVALVALVVRWVGIALPPLSFQPNRQLIDALMARGYWVSMGGELPASIPASFTPWTPSALEPPLIQGVGSISYLLAGTEVLWLPRAIIASCWVICVPAVWGLVRRLVGPIGAAFAALLWLFLPYGVAVSRSFQPDGPMLCLVVLAIWSMVRNHDSPATCRWWSAGLFGAAALLFKPTAIFAVVPALVAIAWLEGGSRALRSRLFLRRLSVIVGPAVVYWLAVTATGSIGAQEGNRFSVGVLLDNGFWIGWIDMIGRVLPLPLVAVAVLGLLFASRRPRALGAALLGGYVIHALVFVHHTATHDYYHVLLVVPMLVGLGAASESMIRVLVVRGVARPAAVLTVAVATVLVLVVGPRPYPYVETAVPPRLEAVIAGARAAGDALGHSEHVLFVSRAYGSVQQYYGYLNGPPWPFAADLEGERMFGVGPLTAEERLEALEADDAPVRWVAESGPIEWVLVTEPAVLEEQPDLARLLRSRFELSVQGDGWTAYRRR